MINLIGCVFYENSGTGWGRWERGECAESKGSVAGEQMAVRQGRVGGRARPRGSAGTQRDDCSGHVMHELTQSSQQPLAPRYNYWPHFTDGEIEAWRVHTLPKITKATSEEWFCFFFLNSSFIEIKFT